MRWVPQYENRAPKILSMLLGIQKRRFLKRGSRMLLVAQTRFFVTWPEHLSPTTMGVDCWEFSIVAFSEESFFTPGTGSLGSKHLLSWRKPQLMNDWYELEKAAPCLKLRTTLWYDFMPEIPGFRPQLTISQWPLPCSKSHSAPASSLPCRRFYKERFLPL